MSLKRDFIGRRGKKKNWKMAFLIKTFDDDFLVTFVDVRGKYGIQFSFSPFKLTIRRPPPTTRRYWTEQN